MGLEFKHLPHLSIFDVALEVLEEKMNRDGSKKVVKGERVHEGYVLFQGKEQEVDMYFVTHLKCGNRLSALIDRQEYRNKSPRIRSALEIYCRRCQHRVGKRVFRQLGKYGRLFNFGATDEKAPANFVGCQILFPLGLDLDSNDEIVRVLPPSLQREEAPVDDIPEGFVETEPAPAPGRYRTGTPPQKRSVLQQSSAFKALERRLARGERERAAEVTARPAPAKKRTTAERSAYLVHPDDMNPDRWKRTPDEIREDIARAKAVSLKTLEQARVRPVIRKAVHQLENPQLLSIKAAGHQSPEMIALTREFGILYRTSLLGWAADELVDRGLMQAGAELSLWWEAFS